MNFLQHHYGSNKQTNDNQINIRQIEKKMKKILTGSKKIPRKKLRD